MRSLRTCREICLAVFNSLSLFKYFVINRPQHLIIYVVSCFEVTHNLQEVLDKGSFVGPSSY